MRRPLCRFFDIHEDLRMPECTGSSNNRIAVEQVVNFPPSCLGLLKSTATMYYFVPSQFEFCLYKPEMQSSNTFHNINTQQKITIKRLPKKKLNPIPIPTTTKINSTSLRRPYQSVLKISSTSSKRSLSSKCPFPRPTANRFN